MGSGSCRRLVLSSTHLALGSCRPPAAFRSISSRRLLLMGLSPTPLGGPATGWRGPATPPVLVVVQRHHVQVNKLLVPGKCMLS